MLTLPLAINEADEQLKLQRAQAWISLADTLRPQPGPPPAAAPAFDAVAMRDFWSQQPRQSENMAEVMREHRNLQHELSTLKNDLRKLAEDLNSRGLITQNDELRDVAILITTVADGAPI